ncbi:reverse transcriptase domain-containing protein [Tanacetum coccineum]
MERSHSRTTNLRNEITRFQQRFSETFTEACDQFKDLLNKCPHDGFSPLHQIDTFYNGLNQSDQDSLNSAAGGNFLTRNTQEALTIIENKSKQVEALVSSMNKPIHSIQEGCETCGGPYPYYECQTADGYTQDSNVPSLEEMMLQHMRSTEAKMQQMQTHNNQQIEQMQNHNNQQIQQLQTHNTQMTNLMGQMQKALQERPQGVLLSITVPNPREDLKVITTLSGMTLAGPSVPSPPSSSSKEVERDLETITDQVLTKSTTRVPPPVVQPSPVSIPSELPTAPASSSVIPE